MTETLKDILKRAEYTEQVIRFTDLTAYNIGGSDENKRLTPIITALVEVIESQRQALTVILGGHEYNILKEPYKLVADEALAQSDDILKGVLDGKT